MDQTLGTETRRILFVDDEPNILDGLRRMLFPMRKQWDMVFADSARQAIKDLALERFDVIVTDMRMPGTDGCELLDQVSKDFPEMVRLVLSGHWDPAMSVRSARNAHQYLTKPCSADVLKNTLERIFALRHRLAGRSLKRLVSGMTTLPSLPEAYSRLMAVLDSSNTSATQIGEVIVTDMAMTAKVLQLANSAFFGISRHLSNPAEATTYLGVDTIRALVLTIGIFSQFSGAEPASLPFKKLQRHSLETAWIARRIARFENTSKPVADDAFLAAMVHDVGKLILATKDCDMYESALTLASEHELELEAVERETFGASHAEVGSYLLWLWGLPDPVTEAVAFHHRPSDSPVNALGPLALVHVAEVLAHEMDNSTSPAQHLDEQFLAGAGLLDRLPAWRDIAREAIEDGAAG